MKKVSLPLEHNQYLIFQKSKNMLYIKQNIITYTIATLLVLLAYSSNAQSPSIWAPSGATWYYDYGYNKTSGYVKMEYIGDSLLQGKQCKVLERTKVTVRKVVINTMNGDFAYNPPVEDTFQNVYTYLENDSVYYYEYDDSSFHFLYSFNAQVGDVLYSHYSPDPISIVDSIGVDVIDGDTLRWQHVSEHPNHNSSHYLHGKIYNRIGPADWYMFPEHGADGHEGGELCSYSDDNFEYNPTGAVCDQLVSIREIKAASDIALNLYPVPAQNQITIDLDYDNIQTIELNVYSALGQLVKQQSDNTDLIQMDLRDLPQGQYWLTARINGEKMLRKAFLKK